MLTYLAYIVGAVCGIINRPKLKSLELTLLADSNKEDVLKSILDFMQDGTAARLNHKIGRAHV